MTTDQPASPEPQVTPFKFDYDAWLVEDAKRRAAFAQEIVQLKAGLFDVLEAHGITLVTVAFDGCGDSGQIESIDAFTEQGEIALPKIDLPAPDGTPEANTDAVKPQPLAEAIETIAYDLLESAHGGWENNEGAYGEFRFDLASRTITLGCNIRISSADYTETSW